MSLRMLASPDAWASLSLRLEVGDGVDDAAGEVPDANPSAGLGCTNDGIGDADAAGVADASGGIDVNVCACACACACVLS